MKRKSRILIILFTLLVAFTYRTKAQVEFASTYVFTEDSIAGFDEHAASGGALANNCVGREYKVYMYKAKREFVNQKYQIKSLPAVRPTLFQNPGYSNRTASLSVSCDNEDFEVITTQVNAPGSVQGWLVASGSNSISSCTSPTMTGNNNYTVYTAPIVDPITNVTVASYFDAANSAIPAGHSFIRLNDDQAGAKASKLTKSFIVGPSNALFEYAYFPVIENGDHGCCDQPGFNIHITITNTVTNTSTVLACPQISVAVPGALCTATAAPGSPVFVLADPNCQFSCWVYHNWSPASIDLTAYIGNEVTIDVVVVDCTFGGHAAYSYFDAKCSPMTILGNNNPFPAGTPSVTLPTCGVSSSTICAPGGLGPYSWAGQGVTAPYNTPLNSNQCFTTSISGDYTLTMNPPGSCNPISRVVTVTITPAPIVVASIVQSTCGGTIATISYTSAGSASVNPIVTFVPPPITSNIGQNTGSGTYATAAGLVSVYVTDPSGCTTSASLIVNPPPPQPTVSILNVTGSPSITCLTPSIVLTGVSGYTFGTLDYVFSSSSFNTPGQTLTMTIGSTKVTLTATDPISNCVATSTIAVFVNTVAPTFNVAPVNQSINCGAGVTAITCTGTVLSPTTNVTQFWYAPGSPNPVPSQGVTSLFDPTIVGANGTNTLMVVNDINGCSTTKYVNVTSAFSYPTFTMTSSQNYSIGCSTTSLTNISISNAQTTSTVVGGSISYTLLPPGYSGGPSYQTSTVSLFNITTPGNYTVIVKDNSDLCESHLPVSIIQNTFAPDISASASTFTLSCAVPSVVLQANSANSAQGLVTYNWFFNNGANPGNVIFQTLPVTINLATPSNSIINTYSLQILEDNNKCVSHTVVTMYQNTRPPKASIAATQPSLTCLTNSISLTNNSSTGILPGTFFISQPVVGLLWEGPTPQLPDSFSSSYYAYTPGIYTLTAEDINNGCTSQTTTTITDSRVYPIIVTNTQVALDCNSATTGGVQLAVTVQSLTASQVKAQWSLPLPTPNVSGANSLTLTTDGIGEYILSVTTLSNGCKRQTFVEVTRGILTGGFAVDKETGFAPLTVNFTNNSTSSSSVSGTSSITSVWSFGNGTAKTTTTNLSTSAVYNAPGTYTVTMFVSKGACRDTVVKVITVDIPSKLVVPNVFTPNGDNNNDLFFLQASNLTQITVQIFDRWGNKVYDLTSSTGNIAWDGKNQSGHEAPDGTYFYTIKATGKDGQNYDTKGTVSLYR